MQADKEELFPFYNKPGQFYALMEVGRLKNAWPFLSVGFLDIARKA